MYHKNGRTHRQTRTAARKNLKKPIPWRGTGPITARRPVPYPFSYTNFIYAS